MLHLFALCFSLSFLYQVHGINNSTCGGCTVRDGAWADSIGMEWTPIFNYFNETVNVILDIKDNSTITTSRIPNTDAASSFSSLCEYIITSMGHLYQNPGNCVKRLVVTDTYRIPVRASTVTNIVTLTYPTSYLRVLEVEAFTSSLVYKSGSTICSSTARAFSVNDIYPIRSSDTSWYSTFYNDGRTVTYLHQLPQGIYETLDSGSLRSCTPGPLGGVPTTKIPILGTASTVYQYSTREGSQPSAQPPSHPSPPNSVPIATALPENNPTSPPPAIPSPQIPPVVPPANPPNSPPPNAPLQKSPPLITPAPGAPHLPNGVYVLPGGSGILLPNGQILKPGESTVVQGTPYSFQSSGETRAIIVGSTVIPLTSTNPTMQSLPAGYSVLASGGGLLVPNGETLKPGSVTTIGGTVISEDAAGSAVAIGASTFPAIPSTTGNSESGGAESNGGGAATNTNGQSAAKRTHPGNEGGLLSFVLLSVVLFVSLL